MSFKTICTAGHIDHGKTALTKALTGEDTDRLQEEKLRGITIDIGFASYGDEATIIDLPGHEKFIRNMAAGASSVDLALLIIAADDGPMPQTREHLEILKMLGVQDGIIVITKTGLVEDEWADLVAEDAREMVKGSFLEGKPVIKADSLSGRGIDELKKAIDASLAALPEQKVRPEFRMPVDRSFTIKGFGAVVTGTILSGNVSVKNSLRHFPSGNIFKVRGLQTHGKDCESASVGARAAINLAGTEKTAVERGDWLAEPGLLRLSERYDCRISLVKAAQPLKHRERLRIHHGAAELIGRILLLEDNTLAPGQSMFAQLELETPVPALKGDRFVLRTYSPQTTIGGGMIIMPAAEKHKRRRQPLFDLLTAVGYGNPAEAVKELIDSAGLDSVNFSELKYKSGLTAKETEAALQELQASGAIVSGKAGGENYYLPAQSFREIETHLLSIVVNFHSQNPSRPGITLAELKSALSTPENSPFPEMALNGLKERDRLMQNGSVYSLAGFNIKLSSRQTQLAEKIMEAITPAGLSAPKASPLAEAIGVSLEEVLEMFAILEAMGRLARLDRDTVVESSVFREYVEKLRAAFPEGRQFSTQEAVIALEASRRMTVTMLEYCDRAGITEREGEVRRVR